MEIDGCDLPVTIVRNARAKRIGLRFDPVGPHIRLTLPAGTSEAVGRRFLRSQESWVRRNLARALDPIPFEPGATIPVRDEPLRLRVDPKAVDPLECRPGEILVARSGGCAALVETWLRREARRDLRAAVARHASVLGVEPKHIAVKEVRSRWGSASARGGINFSWRLIMAPSFVLDYVAAHEVSHLREMNHSPRFWKICRSLCPATGQAEQWLKRHGRTLMRYGGTSDRPAAVPAPHVAEGGMLDL